MEKREDTCQGGSLELAAGEEFMDERERREKKKKGEMGWRMGFELKE